MREKKGRQRWRENTYQDKANKQTSKVRVPQGEDGACVTACLCGSPYLHYLCAGLSDEVLRVRIYDSHLDQSIGLPVSA